MSGLNRLSIGSEMERKHKIKELKTTISKQQQELTVLLMDLNVDEVKKLPKEEQEVKRKEWQDKIQANKSMTGNLQDELKRVRMNKNSSSFFEWHPTGPNRQMRRRARKMKRI